MKKKKTATTVATFGAALGAMGVATELEADVINLSFNPGSVAFDTIGSVSVTVDLIAGTLGTIASFRQWNDNIGKTFLGFAPGSVGSVTVSQSLAAGTSFGGATAVGISASATGTLYFGFNVGGNAGWFSANMGGAGGTINYLNGQYGSMGETVHVPAPGALALLALGAAGIRRKRAA